MKKLSMFVILALLSTQSAFAGGEIYSAIKRAFVRMSSSARGLLISNLQETAADLKKKEDREFWHLMLIADGNMREDAHLFVEPDFTQLEKLRKEAQEMNQFIEELRQLNSQFQDE